MKARSERVNIFFRLTALSGALFIVTIFALVAVVFGDPDAPVARFLNEHGGRLIAGEVGLTLTSGLLAMTVDRLQILRQLRRVDDAKSSDDEPPGMASEWPDE